MQNKNQLLLFLAPGILWISAFHYFYSGKLVLYADVSRNFIYTNYFFNHLSRGVFPLWNPFNAWGRSESFALQQIGAFNPFLYIAFFLHQIGFSMALAYFIYLVSYFFIGVWGFYLLAKVLTKDDLSSYAAMLIFMFSSFGSNLFNDINIINTVIPSIWFFYFLIDWINRPSSAGLLGMTFSMMIIITSFIPFYFLLSFMVGGVIFCFIYIDQLSRILLPSFKYIQKHPWIVISCLLSLGLAFGPVYNFYQETHLGNFVYSWRDLSKSAGTGDLDLRAIQNSSLAGPISLTDLFSYLNNLRAGSAYVPVFAYLVLLLGLAVPISRSLVVLFLTGTLIILISLANATPIHEFLFDHVFFMRKFRNLHFLFWFALLFFILFIAQQFSYWQTVKKKDHIGYSIFILLVHALFFIFLWEQDKPLVTSFIVTILSSLFFLFYIDSSLKRERIKWILLVLIALQPMEVFYYLGQSSKGQVLAYSNQTYTAKESVPQFSFIRPAFGKFSNRQGIYDFGGDITDNPGFYADEFVGSRWSYFLQKNVNREELQNYVLNKFILYDSVQSAGSDEEALANFRIHLSQKHNVAVVNDLDGKDRVFTIGKEKMKVVKEEDNLLTVEGFDINYLKLKVDLPDKKFIVYNDSFHSGWRLKIDGRDEKIYRSNVAFKGWWIPAGEHTVELDFYPFWRQWIYWAILIYFFIFLIVLVIQMQAKNLILKFKPMGIN